MLYRKLLAAFVLIILSIQMSCAQKLTGKITASADSTRLNYLAPGMISITDSIVNYGKLFLNTPYRHGSDGTSTFDCSGFTSYVYRNFGYNLERSSDEQANEFAAVTRDQLKEGDLVYFSGRRRSHRVGHVGIVVSAKDGNFDFIHASVHDGVIVSNSEEDYYKKRYIMANRVINNNQLLAVNSPRKQMVSESMYHRVQSNLGTQQTKKVIAAEYHRVKSGETLSSIANKFDMTVAELKRKNNIKGSKINPKQRLKVKDEKIITVVEPVQLADNKLVKSTVQPTSPVNPTSITETSTTDNVVSKASFGSLIIHLVQKGETLFSISNLYHITIEQLKNWNNINKNTILPGESLKIDQQPVNIKPETPTPSTPVATETPAPKRTHKVLSGESLFDIAKQNNISVDDLKNLNNLSSIKLHPGQELIINKPTDANDNDKPQSQPVISKTEKQNTPSKSPAMARYKVKRGDSFYSIAHKNNCSVTDLKKWNNKSGSKIKPGEKLVIYSAKD